MKYYFVNTVYTAYGSDLKPQIFVCDQHPFKEVADLNKIENYETFLLNWKEITKEEYDMYRELIDEC